MADYGLWQGLEKATGNMAATGMQLIQYKQQQAQNAQRIGLETQRLKIAQDADKRDAQAFEYKQAKQAQEDKMANTPVPLSSFRDRKEFTKGALEWAKTNGFGEQAFMREDGLPFASPKVIKAYGEALKLDTGLKDAVIASNLTDLLAISSSLSAKIAEGKGKPDELAAMTKKRDAADKAYGLIKSSKERAVAEAQKVDKGPPAYKATTREEMLANEQAKADIKAKTTGEKKKVAGFSKEEPDRAVLMDAAGNMTYRDDGSPYKGGQLQPVTEPAQIALLAATTAPNDMEVLADALEAGRTTMSSVAKGMGGANTARAVSIILERRGVNLANLEINIAAKKSALSALEKTVNQLKPFEETARKNLDYASSISKQYMRFKYPDLNKLKIMWDRKTGDPLVAKFKIATYDGMAEAMKHMLAGSGITAAELSQEAQKKATELLDLAGNWKQFDAVVEGINVGLTNRADAYREQLEKLKLQKVSDFSQNKKVEKTVVERRITSGGKKLVKYSDGSIGEE